MPLLMLNLHNIILLILIFYFLNWNLHNFQHKVLKFVLNPLMVYIMIFL